MPSDDEMMIDETPSEEMNSDSSSISFTSSSSPETTSPVPHLTASSPSRLFPDRMIVHSLSSVGTSERITKTSAKSPFDGQESVDGNSSPAPPTSTSSLSPIQAVRPTWQDSAFSLTYAVLSDDDKFLLNIDSSSTLSTESAQVAMLNQADLPPLGTPVKIEQADQCSHQLP